MTVLEIGDTIRCADINDTVNTMYELQNCGVDVCSLYELDGQKGLWLKVTGLEETTGTSGKKSPGANRGEENRGRFYPAHRLLNAQPLAKTVLEHLRKI